MDYDVAMLSGLTLKVVEVARLTGRFLLNERLVFDRSRVEEKNLHDYVSYVDRESERRLVDSLSVLLPGAGLSPKRRLFLIGERLVYGLSIRSTVRPIMFMTSLLML